MSSKNRHTIFVTNDNGVYLFSTKFAYPRTSTPVLGRKKSNRFDADIAYDKWVSHLEEPPSRIQIKGLKKAKKGIISGHLIPMEDTVAKSELNKNLSEEMKTSLAKKIKSVVNDSYKNFLEKASKLLTKKEKHSTCAKNIPNCDCKLKGVPHKTFIDAKEVDRNDCNSNRSNIILI